MLLLDQAELAEAGTRFESTLQEKVTLIGELESAKVVLQQEVGGIERRVQQVRWCLTSCAYERIK